MTDFKPNKYQERIFDFVKNGEGNCIVEAVPGSGKTTVIVKASELIPKGQSIVFLCFNTEIRDELQERLPRGIKASTLHQLGKRMFYMNGYGEHTVKKDKLASLVDYRIRNYDEKEQKLLGQFLMDIVPKVKNSLCNINKEEISRLPSSYFNITDEQVMLVKDILNKSIDTMKDIDFDDMIWLPIKMGFEFPDNRKYDWVMIDELQDISKVQFELIKKICNDNTRIIGVGDTNQCVYQFRCADSSSMNNFRNHFNTKEFPLSISYRCPKNVVKLASEIFPQIEASDDAIDGFVNDISEDKMVSVVKQGDMILCRTNAPLVKILFALIRRGKKARIKGRSSALIQIRSYIDSCRPKNIDDLNTSIRSTRNNATNELELISKQKKYNEHDYRKRRKLASLIDLCDTVSYFSREFDSIFALRSKLDDFFTDEKEDITLSTIHKVKGLEADRVFIYRYDLMPHPFAESVEEFVEETNIEYVAITRSKNELYFISENNENKY